LVVRVPVEISFEGNVVRTSAIPNTGYESGEPEIHIPIALAKRLGVRVEGVRSERYRVVGWEVGALVLGYVDVRVRVEDRVTGWVGSRAVTVIGGYEVLLSDRLVEELGVEIVKPASGLWRFTFQFHVLDSCGHKGLPHHSALP
jgi:hypothetical protein